MPCPNWKKELDPQVYNIPTLSTAAQCAAPQDTVLICLSSNTSIATGITWFFSVLLPWSKALPAEYNLPSVSMNIEILCPAEIARIFWSEGIFVNVFAFVVCPKPKQPDLLCPIEWQNPSVVRAIVCQWPHATSDTLVMLVTCFGTFIESSFSECPALLYLLFPNVKSLPEVVIKAEK